MAKPEMSKRFRRRHGRDKDIKLQEKHTITHGLVESTSNTDPNWTSVEIIFAGFVVGCLVIALGSAFHLRSATYSALQQNWLPRNEYDSVFTYSTVRTVFVPEENITNAEFYKTFATDSGNPVLLKKSLLHRWSAFTKWTPDFLEHVFPSVQVYEQNKTSEFITFHDGKPLERFLTNEKWSDFNGLHNFSSKAVLSNSGPPWLYFSSNLLHLREDYPYGSGVTNDVDPLYPLVVNDSGLQANLWMGSKGIETFMHLDASFNFFAQLHGRKRFTLVPPHVPMYPWSCLHPHIHHAQVPWKQHHNRSALQSKFPDFAASHPSAVVVDVGRGDLLYVPPYWWHHVETLESPSVAVNVWTDAPAYLRIHEVYEHPVPLNADDTDAARIVSVVRFLTMLVSRTELCPLHQNAAEPSDSLLRDWCTEKPAVFTGDARGFFRHLYEQRWRQLLEQGYINSGLAGTQESAMEVDPNAVRTHCQNTNFRDAIADDGRSIDAKLAKRMNSIVALFHEIQPAGVRRLCLGNYIEHVIAAAVGAASVGSCLQNCF
eukprot:m.286577 g.286577  ORF g.286577 m.286577 type:complete len:543 (+) comp19933_c0_seq5:183-1811(+)